MEPYNLISGWCSQYGIPEDRVSFEYADLGFGVAGLTTWWPVSRRIRIQIAPYLEDHGIIEEEALWHEFCHAEDYWKNGSSGHGERWKVLYARRRYPWWVRIVQAFLGLLHIFRRRKPLISGP